MNELQKWHYAPNYCGGDYTHYYMVAYQNRDSNYEVQSNFIVATQRLGGENPPDVIVIRFGDWAFGWFELLMVHEDVEAKLVQATELANDINVETILDWDHYQELKSEEVDRLTREIEDDIADNIESGRSKSYQWDCWGINSTDTHEIIRKKVDEHVT
jgi:hypothetical protein